MGQHYLDPTQYVLGKDDTSPVEIVADSQQQHPDAVLPWRRVEMRYADGTELVLDDTLKGKIALLEGPHGKVYKGLESTLPNLKRELDLLPDPEPRVTDFGEAVRTRRKFALNEENGHRSCTLVNLALAAIRLGRKLRFDPVQQRFSGDEEANRLLTQPMRAPWSLNDWNV
jgi:hypothetical protein